MFDLTTKNWTCFYRVDVQYKINPQELNAAQSVRRKEERAKLREAGFEEKGLIFHFKHLDSPAIKSAAKKKARAMARKVTRKTGVIVEVVEGSYL